MSTPSKKIDPALIALSLENSRVAIDTLVRSHTWGGNNQVNIDTDPTRPTVRVQLSVPGTQPMTLTAELAFGRNVWQVEIGGWSWKLQPTNQSSVSEQAAHHSSALRILSAVADIVNAANK